MSREFKQACETMERLAARRPPNLITISELGKLARKLESLPAGDIGRPPPDMRQIAHEIREYINNGIDLSRRQARQSAWCLWNENTRLADDAELRRKILLHIAAASTAGAFRTLAANFLEAFRPDENGIQDAAVVLSTLAEKWEGNWSDLHQTFRIFDIDAGPKRLAEAVSLQDRAPHLILQDYGVSMMSARGGFVRAVTGALLDHLGDGGEPDHEKRIEKVRKYALSGEGRLLYADMAAHVVRALLEPLDKTALADVLRDKFLAILLRALDDPRLKPAKWRQVPAQFTAMVKSWLAKQSLRQFLDVVGETTDRPDQWAYRRAFWEAVYETGLVSEAWVAFGPRGERSARRSFGKDASFGVVETAGKSVESGHAVLFMRIGDGVVADWSHNGKCNIWSQVDLPDAPELYKLQYRSGEVLIPSTGNLVTQDRLSVSHTSPESYSWQRKVADRIWKMTGRRIQETQYAVRR